MMTMSEKVVKPWFKEPWPWFLMAGPFLVIVAGIITVWYAVTSNDGLVSDDYYKQGLAVNQRLARDQHAVDIGLQADVMISGVQIRLMLTSATPEVMPSRVLLNVTHPTQSGKDQSIELTAESPGFFAGKLAQPLVGRWHVSIEDIDSKWRLHSDFQADAMDSLRIGGVQQGQK